MTLRVCLSSSLLALLCATARLPALDYVWWEGEAPSAMSPGLADQHVFNSPHPLLSGGKSLGGTSQAATWAEYRVPVTAAAGYRFFIRKFWKHGPLRYRWDGAGEWVELRDYPLLDSVKLEQHCINWVPAGSVTLSKGTHTLRVEALEAGKPFVLDCFLLVDAPFNPSGLNRPGEKSGKAEAGTWAFEPDLDDSSAPDALNLRALNPAVAGQDGWLAVDRRGQVVDGKGKPFPLWAVNTGVANEYAFADVQEHARFLAKRGVDMVRFHGHLNAAGGKLDGPADAQQLDALHKLVAAMKGEGIYTTFSPYWAGHSGAPQETMLFWDDAVQAAYKRWLREVLTAPNPYAAGRTPLGSDPALGIMQIQNEDSLFFWTTMHALSGDNLARLTAKYHAWRAANQLAGTPPLAFKFWELGNPTQDHLDTMRFFAETMRTWNTEVERFVHQDLKCPVLINAGNWRTADQVRLLDLERWSYDANAVIGVNRYVGGVHVNPAHQDQTGWMVQNGDLFTDSSKTMDWEALATNARQVAGKAYIISESTWVPPGNHSSEAPFLVAAYSALTGVDAYYWFALGQTGWDPSLNKWQAASPVIMGGFPAAAFLYRTGLVKQGAPALHEERALDDLWHLRSPLLAEEAGFDPNRDAAISPKSNLRSTVPPAAYLVGPVETVFGGDPGKSTAIDLAPYVDTAGKRITSDTRELVMNWGDGLCTLDAPGAAGASGFLGKAGTIPLTSLRISATNEYATVLAVALDRLPLATSKKVLLQITTQNRPFGWRQSPAEFDHDKQHYTGFRIDAVGTAPWNVVDTAMTLTLLNSGLSTATRLDENLRPAGAVAVAKAAGGLTVTPPANAMYVLVQ